VKFTRQLAPDSLELFDLRTRIRAGNCPHCQRSSSLVAHGYLRGHPETGHGQVTRALRFFAPTVTRM
jgi:hypothetical protein